MFASSSGFRYNFKKRFVTATGAVAVADSDNSLMRNASVSIPKCHEEGILHNLKDTGR